MHRISKRTWFIAGGAVVLHASNCIGLANARFTVEDEQGRTIAHQQAGAQIPGQPVCTVAIAVTVPEAASYRLRFGAWTSPSRSAAALAAGGWTWTEDMG